MTEEKFLQANKLMFKDWIRTAADRMEPVTRTSYLPKDSGYYIIGCDKPIPTSARCYPKWDGTQVKYNGIYLWRCGGGGIKSTIHSRHLFRREEHRLNKGRPTNSMKVVRSPLDRFYDLEHNITKCGDGLNAWENGLEIDQLEWQQHTFYVGYFITSTFDNVLERLTPETLGRLPLNLQVKK